MANKVTKVEMYEMLRRVVMNAEVENANELVDFIDVQVGQLLNKAEKAKERAAKKRAEGDALRMAIAGVLDENLKTINDIMEAVQFEGDVTRAKVAARLTQLVKAGLVEKEQVKGADGNRCMAYRFKAENAEEEEKE